MKIILTLIFLINIYINCVYSLRWFDCSDGRGLLSIQNITVIEDSFDDYGNSIHLDIIGNLEKEINNNSSSTLQVDTYDIGTNQPHFHDEIKDFCDYFGHCPYKPGAFRESIIFKINNNIDYNDNIFITTFLAINEYEIKSLHPIFCFTILN